VGQQHAERIADLAKLIAVRANLVEDACLELGVDATPQVDIDETELAPDGADKPVPRVD
jgi:hypothetical protein